MIPAQTHQLRRAAISVTSPHHHHLRFLRLRREIHNPRGSRISSPRHGGRYPPLGRVRQRSGLVHAARVACGASSAGVIVGGVREARAARDGRAETDSVTAAGADGTDGIETGTRTRGACDTSAADGLLHSVDGGCGGTFDGPRR